MPRVQARKQIPVSKPRMEEAEAQAARRVILSGWVTQGPEVAAFEQEFAAFVGAEHACAVSSCTTALHLALRAAGVGPGDEVITASHSFIATASSVRYTGAVPVFVDIEPETFNMTPALIERAITGKSRAVLCVHQMGMPCSLKEIVDVAKRHRLAVVEDAACAVGSQILWNGNWERIGKPHGDVACFSFHPRKLLTTGDGGMLTTSRAEWDRKFRLWRHHSMSVPDTVRHRTQEIIFESYPELGYNYRLTDIQAAIGREQLKRLPEAVQERRLAVERYRRLLAGVPGLLLPAEPEGVRTNWQSFCVRLPEWSDQRKVMQAMLDDGIATRRGIMCAHREPSFASQPWSCGIGPGPCGCPTGACARLRQSEQAQDQSIILPLFQGITEAEQEAVASALCAAIRRA